MTETQTSSFTGAPEGYNNAPKFSLMSRLSNSSNGNFLGVTDGTSAGPGSYPGIGKSSVASKGPSKTRLATFNRRYRDCRALPFSLATLSLHGADRLLLEEGPSTIMKLPRSTFQDALNQKGFCSSSFASEQSRFPPTREFGKGLELQTGLHEARKYARSLPRKVKKKTMGRTMGRTMSATSISVIDNDAALMRSMSSAGLQTTKQNFSNNNSAVEIADPHSTAAHNHIPDFALDTTITWDELNVLQSPQAKTGMPPPAQFKPFESWTANLESPTFKGRAKGGGMSTRTRPWTSTQYPETFSRSVSPAPGASIAFLDQNNSVGDFGGGGPGGGLKSEISHYSDKGLIERRSFAESLWYYGEGNDPKEKSLDMNDVANLENFKPPNKKSMGFPNA